MRRKRRTTSARCGGTIELGPRARDQRERHDGASGHNTVDPEDDSTIGNDHNHNDYPAHDDHNDTPTDNNHHHDAPTDDSSNDHNHDDHNHDDAPTDDSSTGSTSVTRM